MEENKPAVTVLGLGAMGRALASALLAAGHPTTVWNRSPGKGVELVDAGAVEVGTAAEAVQASRLVIVCLLDHQSVVDVLATTSLSGRIVVDLTTGTPAQGRALAEWVTGRDADFLDGGIMAIPPMIGEPGAFVLYSGSRAAFDTYESVLGAFGGSRYVGANPGFASLYDIALLSGMYGMFAGIGQAFALIASEGLSAAEFAPMLTRWLVAMTGMIATTGASVDKGVHNVGVTSNLAMQSAGFSNLIDTAVDQGVSPELLAPLGDVLAERVADGHGDDSVGGIIEVLRKGGRWSR
ncbi:NAD(P)-dependent oxidoreductase [Actinocrispum wychmicini]|uniref:3-hydroxyisobutyrate dehydrogenase-like beta-hydroxyacid dehydrogenase n=1 Tax=Actinocrispum wychmicini TaxID=1213861 RepID=A0A4R2JIL0_9PSEU|nr:NAD(P)-binding domain-containing protein [Actinocrispum wychmicini]TCO58262.1 3-hydroxyisobutyrate dehydrogenase-like beta-hydroxyacid dehydrogenase [Actinocrispum wychmicini]